MVILRVEEERRGVLIETMVEAVVVEEDVAAEEEVKRAAEVPV